MDTISEKPGRAGGKPSPRLYGVGAYPFCGDTPQRPAKARGKAPLRTHPESTESQFASDFVDGSLQPSEPPRKFLTPCLSVNSHPPPKSCRSVWSKAPHRAGGWKPSLGEGHLPVSCAMGMPLAPSRQGIQRFPWREPLRRSLLDLMASTRRGGQYHFSRRKMLSVIANKMGPV